MTDGTRGLITPENAIICIGVWQYRSFLLRNWPTDDMYLVHVVCMCGGTTPTT